MPILYVRITAGGKPAMVCRRVIVCLFVVAASLGCEPADVDPQVAIWQPVVDEENAFLEQHRGVVGKVTALDGHASGYPANPEVGVSAYSLMIALSENPRVNDAALKNLLDGSPSLLFLGSTPITDDGLAALRQDPGICVLDLHDTSIGDAGIGHVSTLPSLRALYLGTTNVSDQGLRTLSAMSTLERLSLPDTFVTDDGVALLVKLPHLRSLNLDGTRITDKVIDHLSRIKNLKEVKLSRTEVTAEGAERLRQALPGCQVDHVKTTVSVCDLLPLIAEEQFGSVEDVFFVTTVLPVGAYEFGRDSIGTTIPASEIARVARETKEGGPGRHRNCAGWKSLARMDEGCRETLLFPVADSVSNRFQVTHPFVLSENRVATIVRMTNCRTYFIAKLYVFVKNERWEIESATTMWIV
ncbi:MAG: hypothetical protein KF777_15975 [Planctomycetaceae bacterium]|nr:hypothetical protein [Planctomycetaceae bacterium]